MAFRIETVWTEDDDIALALSGGIDSMVLYHLLTNEYKHTYKSLTVLHVNHNVRSASQDEAAYIEKMTEKDGVRCETAVLNFSTGFSQEKGRVKRYEFFEQVLKQLGISYLLMGHHADDQHETVLQQLLTGRHLYGNLGIPEMNDRGAYTIVRPLSHVTKEMIQIYSNQHQVVYFEDASNAGDDYTRNYVRHHVIPPVKEAPELDVSQLEKVRQDINELSDFAYAYAEKFTGSYERELSRKDYQTHSPVIRRYILSAFLKQSDIHLGRSGLEALDSLLLSKTSQGVYRTRDAVIHVEYDRIYIGKQQEETVQQYLSIEDNGEFIYNDYHVTVQLPSSELPLTLRQKADGDKVSLKNTGTKKVSRLFIDKKIPAAERQKMPVAVNSHGIIIAVGTIYNIIEPSENRLLKITKEFNDDNSK